MPQATLPIIQALWTRALEAEFGIAVETEDKPLILNLLYEQRKRMLNPALADLVIIKPGRYPKELWIVKKSVEMELTS